MAMKIGGEMWRKEALYDIMDGKSTSLVAMIEQDPELKKWKCKQAGDECVGFTLLHAAVRYNNPAALYVLLENGAVHILAKDKGGKSPFDWAITNSEPAMIKAMLDCAALGSTTMPNLELALRNADDQVEAAERSGTKVAEAKETRALIFKIVEDAERERKAKEEAEAAAAAEARRLLEEEVERAAKEAVDAAAAAAAREAEERRRQLEAEAQARLVEEARLREEERLRREQEEEEEEARRNARDAKTQMIHFSGLVESSLLRKGIGKDAPIIVVRVRPLSAREFADEPVSMLGDADGKAFEESDSHPPGLNRQYSLGDRLFGCHALQRDRDPVYGHKDVQYVDTDQNNCYLEVGGTIIDSMTKGTNCTVIVCGTRGAGKTYTLGRPYHDSPAERDEYDEGKGRWTAGNLVKSDDSGLVERTGRDLMAYRTVLQAREPSAKLFVVMTCFVIYQEKMYDLLAKRRDGVLNSSKSLKVVGQEVKQGAEGRGIFVQGLTSRTIAQEAPAKGKAKGGRTKEKSVRGWLMMANRNRKNLAKDLKAGDKELRRACCVTMFETLQLSEVKETEQNKSRRRGGRSGSKDSKAEAEKQLLYSSVTFVDLPGAVRQPSDDGVKKKEDVAITKMQACLSNCVDLMTAAQKQKQAGGTSSKKVVIPWRNSKLTMLLRDKIGGGNLTLMFGAISPARAELENSRRTLEFLRICGELRQKPIDERDRNVSVMQIATSSDEEKKAKAVQKAAEKAAIIEERKARRARGEKIYDDDGEELLDDDDLEDPNGSAGLGSLLDDPDAIMDTIADITGEDVAQTLQTDPRLAEHAGKWKAVLPTLPEKAVIQTILRDGAISSGTFHQRMTELDAPRLNLFEKLRQKESKLLQLLAELKSALQVYLEFETQPDEGASALRARLTSLLGVGTASALSRQKSRGKFLNAFEDIGAKAERAWMDAQFNLIQELCDKVEQAQNEVGMRRLALLPLLEQQRDAIVNERLRIVDEHAKLREANEDGGDPSLLDLQLHDLGLLTMHVDGEIASVSSPQPTDILEHAVDYSKTFGRQLQREVNASLEELMQAKREPSKLKKLRSFGRLVAHGGEAIDEMEISEETRAARREKVQEEVSFIAGVMQPPKSPRKSPPNLLLGPMEAEMSHMAKGLSDAITMLLKRINDQKLEDMRTLEERLAIASMLKSEARRPREPPKLDATSPRPQEVFTPAPKSSGRARSTPPALLAAGEWHTACVRPSDGAVFSWGGGNHAGGQLRCLVFLGQGEERGPCVRLPTRIVGLNGIRICEVSAGTMHTILLGADGSAWSSGKGKFGALGHGDWEDRASPQRITGLGQVHAEQVAAGAFHTLVLSSDGDVYSFGWGAGGRLGLGTSKAQQAPQRVDTFDTNRQYAKAPCICQVSAGATHSLAVDDAGRLFGWGCGAYGRLGLGENVGTKHVFPTLIELPDDDVRIHQASAGGCHTLVVATDGALYSFGCGGSGRLGHGEDQSDCWKPKRVQALNATPIHHAVAGATHSVVITKVGGVVTFGNNSAGQLLGHGRHENQLEPTVAAALVGEEVLAVALGLSHTVVQLAAGEVRAFGSNDSGQLGTQGDLEAASAVVQIPG